MEGTHEPIIDSETFEKVQVLLSSRRHTRSRTYDFALKGLIFCHECGHPLSVINRKNAKGDDVLYFICRTYQRNTRPGVCTSHSIQERTVTRAVLTKIHEIYASALQPDALFSIAYETVQKAQSNPSRLSKLQAIQSKLDALTANLDRIYDERLSGLLSAEDFARIYQRTSRERRALEERKRELSQQTACPVSAQDRAHALVQQFLQTLDSNRALLVSLIARVELTQDKEIILYFRFHAPEAIF